MFVLQCITDEYLKQHFDGAEEATYCDYCERGSDEGPMIAIDVEDLLRLIAGAVTAEFSDPADELPFESREGG